MSRVSKKVKTRKLGQMGIGKLLKGCIFNSE